MKKESIHLSWGILIVILFASCNNSGGLFADKNLKEGAALSRKYCASCHQFPEPSLLDKNTWAQYVLPKMAPYVGFELFAGSYIAKDSGIGLDLQQWNNMYRYYVSEAPEPPLEKNDENKSIDKETTLFAEIPYKQNIRVPATTMVFIDSSNKKLVFGDGMTGKLYIVTGDLQLKDSIIAGTGISNVRINKGDLWILSMGVMHPSDEKAGTLLVTKNSDTAHYLILDSLQRPVHAAYADLNTDQQEDIVLCEFGDKLGSFGWWENKGNDHFVKHILRPLPGAIKSVVQDFNQDGKPDILVLMAQGDEGMFIYYNEGNGNFSEHRILRFPPSYGSNYFELADFNKDGFPDILTSNGDNGDYPPVLKPYHGIRIFINNGKNEFEEKLFLPVNGIGKVIARDFDADGDLDLASIAFFADFRNNPSEAFIYWENNGSLKFVPSTIKGVSEGRWISMDAGDYDGDGDLDLLLGNADFRLGDIPSALKEKWDNYSPSLLILKNQLR